MRPWLFTNGIYIYIYIYICVCVCVRACVEKKCPAVFLHAPTKYNLKIMKICIQYMKHNACIHTYRMHAPLHTYRESWPHFESLMWFLWNVISSFRHHIIAIIFSLYFLNRSIHNVYGFLFHTNILWTRTLRAIVAVFSGIFPQMLYFTLHFNPLSFENGIFCSASLPGELY